MSFTYDLQDGVAYNADIPGKLYRAMGSFVIPEYLGELLITTSANPGKVTVSSGASIHYAGLYTNSEALELSIDAAVNNRIDLIILKYDSGSTEIYATVRKGTEAAIPGPPSIPSTMIEERLAWVWVPAGFNPAVNTIPATDIHDLRQFRQLGISKSPHLSAGSLDNLMHNSEFIGYSDYSSGNSAPEGWRVTAAPPTSITGVNSIGFASRGRSVRIVGNAGEGMQTQIRVENGMYTLYTVLKFDAAGGTARFTVNGVSYDIFNQTGTQEVIIRTLVTNNEITISITSNAAASAFFISQLSIYQGYVVISPYPKHEIIYFNNPLTDASWTATAKSTGVTVIDLKTSFGSVLLSGTNIRGVLMRFQGNDSGSLANPTYMEATSTVAGEYVSRLILTSHPNDKPRSCFAVAPMVGGMGTTFSITVAASGAGTFDATIEILGIIV